MNKLRIAMPSLALLVIQIPVGWAVCLAVACARHHWASAGDMELPVGTIIAIRFGFAIPVTAAVASVCVLMLSRAKSRSCIPLVLGIAISEILVLAFFAPGLVLPAMTILYRMGNL